MRRPALHRRHWSSWPALLVVLLVLVAAAGTALVQLQDRSQRRAEQQAIGMARVISDLVVLRNVVPDDFVTGGLSPARNMDMQYDLAVLDADNRAAGLELWALDGRLLFADAHRPTSETALPRSERDRAATGIPWVVTDGKVERGTRPLDVFLPFKPEGARGLVGVVEVLFRRSS